MPVTRLVDRAGDGFASSRIYRRVPRGRAPRRLRASTCAPTAARTGPPHGRARPASSAPSRSAGWSTRSPAHERTWKVISADLPLSIPSNWEDDRDGPSNGDDGAPTGREPEIARVLSAFKRNGVTNVVWITADVHYTAAHHYDPSRARFHDFDPFWEFVSGPMAAETFPDKSDLLDRTFGPEVVFSKGNDSGRASVAARRQPVLRPRRHRCRRAPHRHAVRRRRGGAVDQGPRPGAGHGSQSVRSRTRSARDAAASTRTALGWSTRSTQARASSGDLPNSTCRATSRSRRSASSTRTCQTSSSSSRTATPARLVEQQVVALRHHQLRPPAAPGWTPATGCSMTALERRRQHQSVAARRPWPAARRTPRRRTSPARPCGRAARAGRARRRRGGSRPSAPPRRRTPRRARPRTWTCPRRGRR